MVFDTSGMAQAVWLLPRTAPGGSCRFTTICEAFMESDNKAIAHASSAKLWPSLRERCQIARLLQQDRLALLHLCANA